MSAPDFDACTTIVPATDADAATVSELLFAAFVEFESKYTEAAFRATTPPPEEIARRIREGGSSWIAFDVDAPVGTVSAMIRGDEAYIRSMAVLQTARGSGIGSKLLAHAQEFAVCKGCTSMALSTTPFLTAAIRLYESAGFVRVDDGPRDLFGTPLFGMRKRL